MFTYMCYMLDFFNKSEMYVMKGDAYSFFLFIVPFVFLPFVYKIEVVLTIDANKEPF